MPKDTLSKTGLESKLLISNITFLYIIFCGNVHIDYMQIKLSQELTFAEGNMTIVPLSFRINSIAPRSTRLVIWIAAKIFCFLKATILEICCFKIVLMRSLAIPSLTRYWQPSLAYGSKVFRSYGSCATGRRSCEEFKNVRVTPFAFILANGPIIFWFLHSIL